MAVIEYASIKPSGLSAHNLRWRTLRSAVIAVGLRAISIGAFLLIWSAFSLLPWVVQVPSPTSVVKAAIKINPTTFMDDIILSVARVGLGFVFATIVGIPMGVAIGYSQKTRDLLFPPIELTRPVPPIAWIPLAILFFPHMESMIIFLTFYGAFFPIVYNTIAGVENVRSTYIRAGQSLGASEWTLFWEIVVPSALPVIFTGLNIAIGVAWLMVVAGEMIANKGGVGAFTWQSYQTAQYPLIFVGMATIGILGYASSLLIRGVSRLFLRWDTV